MHTHAHEKSRIIPNLMMKKIHVPSSNVAATFPEGAADRIKALSFRDVTAEAGQTRKRVGLTSEKRRRGIVSVGKEWREQGRVFGPD